MSRNSLGVVMLEMNFRQQFRWLHLWSAVLVIGVLVPVGEGLLARPIKVFDYEPTSIWDAAAKCVADGGYLPEVANVDDLRLFLNDLDKFADMSGQKPSSFQYSLASTRWNDVLNGVDNSHKFPIPSSGFKDYIPVGDGNLWFSSGYPDNNNKNQYFITFFKNGLLNDQSEPLSSQSNIPRKLACSSDVTPGYCFKPPLKADDQFDVEVVATDATTSAGNDTYSYGTNATYICPGGFVFAHTINAGKASRFTNVTCFGYIGWAERPVNMNCVLDPLEQKFSVAGSTYQAVQANSSRIGANRPSINFFDAATLCNTYSGNDSALADLPASNETDDKGNRVPNAELLELLTYWSRRLKQAVALGTSIRYFDPSQYADAVERDAAYKAEWHKKVDATGFKFLIEPSALATSQASRCLVFSYDFTSNVGGLASLSCSFNALGVNTTILCQSGEGVCDTATTEPVPVTRPSSATTASKTTTAGTANPSQQPFGATLNVSCNCPTVFNDTQSRTKSTKCYGSLGWTPDPLPVCVQASRTMTLSTGQLAFLVNATSTNTNHTAAAQLCYSAVSAATPSSTLNAVVASATGASSAPKAGLLELTSNDKDVAALKKLIEDNCLADAEIPVANNVVQNFTGSTPVTETAVVAAWRQTHPYLQRFMNLGNLTWDFERPPLCAAVNTSLNPTQGNLAATPCDQALKTTRLLCQIGMDVCQGPPPMPALIVNYTGGLALNTANKFPFGTTATHRCNCSQTWNGSASQYFSPELQCYGSFGWFPRINSTCQGMQFLETESANWTLIQAPLGIEQGAQICFSNFSGAIFELRSRATFQSVMSALGDRGCLRAPTGKTYDEIYVAPTAWTFKERLPPNKTLSANEVSTLWQYSDGSSVTADIFDSGEPQNYLGREQCVAIVQKKPGFGNDITCFRGDPGTALLCQQSAPENLTSCPLEPRNPTLKRALLATVKYIPATAGAPYPFGTVAQFQCPCGSNWAYVKYWANPFFPTTRTDIVNATCLGTLGWGTYDVTYCVPQNDSTSTPLTSTVSAGTVFLTFGNFSGNHTDEALRANLTEGRSLLNVGTQADLDKINELLNSWPCAAGEVPVANNILRYFKQVQDEVTTLQDAWNQAVTKANWHIGEPSEEQACAVLRADSKTFPRKWMLAVKNCSAASASNFRLTMNATAQTGYGGKSIGTNCSMVPPEENNVALFSDGQTEGTSWGFGTFATHRCPCGQVVVGTANLVQIRESRCYGSFGWFPWDISSCEQASKSFSIDGVNYVLDDGNSSAEVGIVNAMKQCRALSNNSGTIAEIVSVDQISRMVEMLNIHCVPYAYVAPTSWNFVQLARPSFTLTTAADFSTTWRYSSGQNISDVVRQHAFLSGQPNNMLGRQQCLRIYPTITGNANRIVMADADCWDAAEDDISHFCAMPGNASVTINTRCAAPWNPTWNHSVPALSTFPHGQSDAAYGTTFDMTCPDGYTWANVTKWATDDANHSSPLFGLRRPKVTVECLGSLGWTMYSVTECILATPCGVPIATSNPNVTSWCDLSSSGVYRCIHTCKDPKMNWLSGAKQQILTCQKTGNKWTTYSDQCGTLGCDRTLIPSFPGVNRLWPNESSTVGSEVFYACPVKTSFNGLRTALNISLVFTCRSNYTWTLFPSSVTCKNVSWCEEGELPTVSNGSAARVENGSNWIEDTVTFTFDDRIEVYTCTSSGNWSKTLLPKPCSPPASVPQNVSSSCSADANGNLEVCNHTCKNTSHVWMSGNSYNTITCQTNGIWTTYSDACVAGGISCNTSDPKTFPGVTLNWSGNRSLNTQAVYSCVNKTESFDGKKTSLNQTLSTRCSSDGSWAPEMTNVECKPVSWCDENMIEFSPSEATKETFGTNWIGDAVVLNHSNRTETYVCLENGEWNMSIQAKCASQPDPPPDVTSVCNSEPYGVRCNHTCANSTAWKSGATFRTVTCNYTQDKWTSYEDRCVTNATCDGSLIRNFSGVSLNWTGDVKDGAVATYSCSQNFTLNNQTGSGYPNATRKVECLSTGNWSEIPTNLTCTLLPVCNSDALPPAGFGVNRVANGTNQLGDTFSDFFADRMEIYTCLASGNWQFEVMGKGFPERIPVPTLPSYPVDFVETTLYHWGRAVENATCTGCLTGNISAPIESPGPTQFGQGVEIRGWDNECLEDNDFERRANFTCFANPMTCANGSNGISMGFFYKRGIPMKDVYLVYFNPKNSSANYPTKETLVSSGGDREGHPGIHVWWEGPFLGVLVSTGELYWEVLFLPKLFNDTWNNIGFRWFRPTPGVDDDGRLEVLINVEQQAATNQAKRASRVQSMLLPPTMLMGCHKDSTNTQKRFYGEGFFDEVAFWDTFIFDNTSRMFAGGYLPELNGVPTSVILDSIRESAKLEDERTRQVAWIAVQSIASDTNMTSEPVRPADAALNKTGETPSQQVENLVKFVTTLQSAEYISSSNSIGAVAKAARTSMSATSTLLCGNRHAWEEIADAGYKPGAYALVKSQNDYFMNMADSIAVDTKMTSAQMIDVTSDEIVSKLGVARIGHLRQSPTLKFPNYEDEIWGNGSMSKKFDYPVDTIEVPLGLYFPSSKTCDGTNLVNIEMNAYKNLDDFMPPNKVNPLKIVSQDNVIDSNILYFAFTLNKNIPKAKVAGCQPDALAMISNPIKLLFRHKMDEPAQEAGFKSRKLKFHTEEVEYNIKVRRCVWWNPSMNEFGGWDPSGCNIYDTADNFTMCECAAQGLFGILGEMIQHYELPTEPTWLTVVKFVGYGLSILCLPLFIVIVLKSKDHLHDQFHIMRANLAFALLVGLILHCVSDLHSIRDSRHACTAISVMFHYFYTAAGAWFCFESYASFVAITQGIIGGKLRAYIPLCWGLPFLSVGAALIQDMLSYGTDPRCMISFDNEMKWIFFGPLLTFASIGFLLSAIVICNISTPALRKDHIADELVSVGQGLAAQVTYFLCTWIAGVCAYFIYDWTIETPGFYALFQVLNAYTGVFYLVFMGFISLRFRMVVLGVAQKRKLMILQYLTRNQHEQLKPTPSVDNQQSDELPDELFAEGGPSSGRRKILTST